MRTKSSIRFQVGSPLIGSPSSALRFRFPILNPVNSLIRSDQILTCVHHPPEVQNSNSYEYGKRISGITESTVFAEVLKWDIRRSRPLEFPRSELRFGRICGPRNEHHEDCCAGAWIGFSRRSASARILIVIHSLRSEVINEGLRQVMGRASRFLQYCPFGAAELLGNPAQAVDPSSPPDALRPSRMPDT